MRKLGLIAALVAMLVVAVAAPAAAGGKAWGPGGAVKISDLVSNDTDVGDFVARGSAVRKGLVCATGESLTVFSAGEVGPTAFTYKMTKTMTCDDPSGSFVIKANVNVPLGSTVGKMRWRISKTDGTGNYTKLLGWGRGRVDADPGTADVHHDFHTGVVHRTRR